MLLVRSAVVLFLVAAVADGDTFWKIPADTNLGFSWPYYLATPDTATRARVLLVEPNNSPDRNNDWTYHDDWAGQLVTNRCSFASELGVPLLVPSFHVPRDPWQVFPSQLNRAALTNSLPGLVRYDLQLIAMIDDARRRLADVGIEVNRRVFMMGFSSSGMFANRFSLLHPDRVKAVAVGAPGVSMACTATWKGETLNYPVGTADIGALIGLSIDMTRVRHMPMYFYMGDQDIHNDPAPVPSCFEPAHGAQILRLFGANQVERWPEYERLYASAGCDAQFVLYPNIGHALIPPMLDDIRAFFNQHRRGPVLVHITAAASTHELSWDTDHDTTYRVHTCTSLTDAAWFAIGPQVHGNGESVTAAYPTSAAPSRHYRVIGTADP